jgi:hypothetical protein
LVDGGRRRRAALGVHRDVNVGGGQTHERERERPPIAATPAA